MDRAATMLIDKPPSLYEAYYLEVEVPDLSVSFSAFIDTGSPVSMILDSALPSNSALVDNLSVNSLNLAGINNSNLVIRGLFTTVVFVSGRKYEVQLCCS